MIKFDFSKNIDCNGFIRLKDVPGFDKFIKTWEKMTTYVSTDPYSALYKDYSKTTYSFTDGTYNFSPMSNAEVYFKRIAKYLPTGYVMLSILKNDGKRDNEIYFVYKFDYIVCIFINSIKNLLFLNISNRYIATYKNKEYIKSIK